MRCTITAPQSHYYQVLLRGMPDPYLASGMDPLSQKDKSGRSVVPVHGLQNAHIPRDWEPATNRDSASWAARDSTVSCARTLINYFYYFYYYYYYYYHYYYYYYYYYYHYHYYHYYYYYFYYFYYYYNFYYYYFYYYYHYFCCCF
ncbi:hypothetical protein DPMN_169655 [Dreissena polymorpha]|uniref:Uncharacterized protein n=1 Tax=Dreissena polymorpha TaxID=45954 RepID=A0A9D4DVX8_DREPO|nr:hypothetical protein DPMN_169655 [Dreissena polymorpha]